MSCDTNRSRLFGLFPLATILMLTGCVLIDSDPSYVYQSGTVYDGARTVKRQDFRQAELLEFFSRFVDKECRERKLARLTVSPSVWSLRTTFNSALPEVDSTNSVRDGSFRLHLGNPDVAQLWCFDNEATALVRRSDGTITRHQIAGRSDAREPTIAGTKLTLIGMNLRPGTAASITPANPHLFDTVSLYVLVGKLPELSLAKSIHEELENKVGINVFLTLRTDPFFVQYAGPPWDIFTVPLPEGSAVRFLDRPHIVCPPRTTGGDCLLVTSPPMLPAEAWRSRPRADR